MSLDKYWEKRDFEITAEPRGEVIKSSETLSFFIQRHHASRLHYDFRLELDGTLKSWAVPKGPSLDPSDKRLAVHVEDHPLTYGSFEGRIPKGQYGAGGVVLWDKGIWIPIGDPKVDYQKGNLKFELLGEKLSGKWALVRMKKKSDEDDKQDSWLLIKEKDDHAKSGQAANVTENRAESVLNLKTKTVEKTKTTSASSKTQTKQPNTEKIPDKISPQLATLVSEAPVGEEWISEVKFDGYRALSRIESGKVKMFTRNGHDWTKQWKMIAEQLEKLPIDNAWVDGEVVAVKDGKINFGALSNYDVNNPKDDIQLKYYIFDLIYLNGQDISSLRLLDRKLLLKEILSSQTDHSILKYSEHNTGAVKLSFESTCKLGLEGIIVKNPAAPYVQARTKNWLKLKCSKRQEFIIGGFTKPAGSRSGFGALLLGYYSEQKEFIYAGRVGTGFNVQVINNLMEQFKSLKLTTAAFVNPPKGYQTKGITWLKPKLVCEVKFAEWTEDNVLRHPSYVGLREDKTASKISREIEIDASSIDAKSTSELESDDESSTKAEMATNKKSKIMSNVETKTKILLTHPERVIYTSEKITKSDVADYYLKISEWLMPHLIDRPLSLLRCPDGAEKACFFQKHLDELNFKFVKRIEVDSDDKGKYLIANEIDAVMELVQLGVIEFHTWGSKLGDLNKPDRLTFDLNPDLSLPWEKVKYGALLIKCMLDTMELQSFIKTTGGKGLHIVVPIKPKHDFSVIKAFTKGIANYLAETIPSHFTAVMSKEKRKNKIFIDYLRNGKESTAIAAYSLRARAGATISTPITWEELKEEESPDRFKLLNIFERMSVLDNDPWSQYKNTQIISPSLLKTYS
ncbi:MAG: DNA ligase D [Methylotenera sp.]|uniref:DNA ligase D n=1 Tax=Methylotenera sp. TaxID=2051956 RepID=UPI0024887906|nr:DNA ligase D [Methylotenera sp.]MDI1308857.1 DNA ligase D [Methylotenera sp.]